MSAGTETVPDLQKQNSDTVYQLRVGLCVSVWQRSYKQMEQLRENSYGTLTDTPELLHASYLRDIYSQVCVDEWRGSLLWEFTPP